MFVYHHSITLKARLLLIQRGADSVTLSLRQHSSAIAIYVPAPFETPFRSFSKCSSPTEAAWSDENSVGCGSKDHVSEGQPTTLGSCLPSSSGTCLFSSDLFQDKPAHLSSGTVPCSLQAGRRWRDRSGAEHLITFAPELSMAWHENSIILHGFSVRRFPRSRMRIFTPRWNEANKWWNEDNYTVVRNY